MPSNRCLSLSLKRDLLILLNLGACHSDPLPRSCRGVVAPAVGDIAVGTTAIPNPNLLNISGPTVSVKYRQTNARHAFEDLVSRAGYGFVWVPADPRFKSSSTAIDVPTELQSSSGFDPINPMGADAQLQQTAQPPVVDSSAEPIRLIHSLCEYDDAESTLFSCLQCAVNGNADAS